MTYGLLEPSVGATTGHGWGDHYRPSIRLTDGFHSTGSYLVGSIANDCGLFGPRFAMSANTERLTSNFEQIVPGFWRSNCTIPIGVSASLIIDGSALVGTFTPLDWLSRELMPWVVMPPPNPAQQDIALSAVLH